MYSKVKQDNITKESARKMFENPAVFFELAMQTISIWPKSTDHNLSYFKSNRRSYLGQATACFKFGCNIKTTCDIWKELSLDQKNKANMIADLVLEYYDQEVYPSKKKEALSEELS